MRKSAPCLYRAVRQAVNATLSLRESESRWFEKAGDGNNGDDSAITQVNIRCHQKELLGREESCYAADGLLHLKLTDLVGRKARRRAYLHRYELYILHLLAALRSRSNDVSSDEPVIHVDPWQDDLAHTQPV